MTDPNHALEHRLDRLTKEVGQLKQRLESLSRRLAAFEAGTPAEPPPPPPPLLPTEEGIWAWVGKSSFLPRLAAVSFMLVFALMLRVLADGGAIGIRLGTFVGIAYTALLVVWGGQLLAKKSAVGPIFPICGAFLLYTIVLEAHSHFDSLSAPAAYGLLGLMMVGLNVLGITHRLSAVSAFGTLGSVFTALSLDFPRPYFPALILLLLIANVTAAVAGQKQSRSEWVRWPVYVVTILAWLLWAAKLRVPLSRHAPVDAALAGNWFLPLLFVFAVVFIAVPARRALRNGTMPLFDMMAPTVTAFWTSSAAWSVLAAGLGPLFGLGLTASVLAAANFAIAVRLLKGNREGGGPGVCVFTTTAALFFMVSVPAMGGILIALPIWAVTAFGLARMSAGCEIGGIRLLSYFVQAAACAGGLLSGVYATTSPAPFAGMAVAIILAVASGRHYRWSRRHPVVCSSGIFPALDPNDRSGAILLLAMLANIFFALQLGGILLLTALGVTIDPNTITGVRSVLINAGAIGLMVLGLRRVDREILGTAVAVTLIGGIKVFGHDLFKVHGMPLVLSVFTFGLVAAVGTVVMSRWQQVKNMSDKRDTEPSGGSAEIA